MRRAAGRRAVGRLALTSAQNLAKVLQRNQHCFSIVPKRDFMTNERRAFPRNRTYFMARATYNNRFSTMDCFVRNMSKHGARIVFSDLAAVPGEFDISIDGRGESRRARVVWRSQTEAGILFSNDLSEKIISLDAARKIASLETERDELSRRVAQLSEPA
jgi:hypothetical protein